MPAKKTTWAQKKEINLERLFVGREDVVNTFVNDFLSESPEYMVISVVGEGGVGKSTLLKRFEAKAESPDYKAFVAICNSNQDSPIRIMDFISQQLSQNGITNRKFDERLRKYRQLKQEIENDPESPQSLLPLLSKGVTNFAIKSLRRTPIAGPLFDYVDEKGAGDAVSELLQYGIKKWGNKDEVRLLLEPEQVLTPLFVGLLGDACQKQLTILMFDTFEETSQTISHWLLSLCDAEFGEVNTNLRIVISGREALGQEWKKLTGLVHTIELDPFTQDETILYMNNLEVKDAELIKQIYTITGGLPALIELIASTKPEKGKALSDFSGTAVELFLKLTPDEEHREIALTASVPRQFNQDILSAAIGSDISRKFRWLSKQSFVRADKERGYYYHEIVRELILQYLLSASPFRIQTIHENLYNFFKNGKNTLNIDADESYKNDKWKKSTLDEIYHGIGWMRENFHPALLEQFIFGLYYNEEFAENITQTVLQCAKEYDIPKTINLSHILLNNTLLQREDSGEPSELQKQIDGLKKLSVEKGISPITQSMLQALLGRAYGKLFEDNDTQKDASNHAIEHMKTAIELNPANYTAHVFLASVLILAGRLEEAISTLGSAIEIKPDSSYAYRVKGYVLNEAERPDDALQAFNKAVELEPENKECYRFRGGFYEQQKDYSDAIRDFTHAIDLGKKEAWSYAHRGESYRMLEDYENAINDFNKALEIRPRYAWVLIQRAFAYKDSGKEIEAIEDLSKAIELKPNNDWLFSKRCEIYNNLGESEKALQDIDKAIEFDSSEFYYFYLRGLIRRNINLQSEAIEDFSRAIELSPKDSDAMCSRGEIFRQLEEYEKAIADFTNAIEIDSSAGSYFGCRGACYVETNQVELALEDLNRAIELETEYPFALAHRGKVYWLKKQYPEAIKDLNRAVELDPNFEWAYAVRGNTYFDMGDYEKALTDTNRALEFNSSHPWYLGVRGASHHELINYSAALDDFSQRLEGNEQDDWALRQRSKTFRKLKMFKESAEDLSKLIEMSDAEDWDYYERALDYIVMGESDKANSDLEQAIQLANKALNFEPDNWRILLNLALYYYAYENPKNGKEIYVRAINKNIDSSLVEMAINDLDEYLTIGKEDIEAKQILAELKKHLDIRSKK